VGDKHSLPPLGIDEHPPDWHFSRFVEFTQYKGEIGEPSPHLAIVGHLIRKMNTEDKLWMLGCYAATYCLPSAQVIWSLYPLSEIREKGPKPLEAWLTKNWKGIITRTERRCVRTPKKMTECLVSFTSWVDNEFPALYKQLSGGGESVENYDTAWESVEKIKFFGRYINIRFIEGLRRYCGVPALLYDIRSVGGWSPKRALCYLYPKETTMLLKDDKASNDLTNELAIDLMYRVQADLPKVDEYILAAMLCEYKACFENYKQYPGWTIDQEPLLYDKVFDYWGDDVDRKMLWRARKALFPPEVLGEISGWNGTRWSLTETLRDHGYVWSDLLFDYGSTKDIAKPVKWIN
jgi:hypothetical protein